MSNNERAMFRMKQFAETIINMLIISNQQKLNHRINKPNVSP